MWVRPLSVLVHVIFSQVVHAAILDAQHLKPVMSLGVKDVHQELKSQVFLVLQLMVETLELLDTFVCCDRFPSGDLAGGSFQLTLAIVSLLG